MTKIFPKLIYLAKPITGPVAFNLVKNHSCRKIEETVKIRFAPKKYAEK